MKNQFNNFGKFNFLFLAFFTFMATVSVLGQNTLNKDLSASFNRYNLLKFDKKVILDKAKSEQLIEFQAYGREFEFVLIPNDLRAANYRAVETTSSGEREMGRAEITTYKGKLLNDPDSEVRFTVTEENIEGFIYTGGSKFFITEAKNFSKRARQNDVIVYSDGDLVKTFDLSDDVGSQGQELESKKAGSKDIEGKIDFGLGIIKRYLYGAESSAETSTATADLRVIEIATEADSQWVTQSGGASAANNEILGILNLVDGIYKRDLNLTVTVTFQHAWSTSDPFSLNSLSDLLSSFQSYWNTNYPHTQYPRDSAHLFTGKTGNAGLSNGNFICRHTPFAYSLSARSGGITHLITAHEIGHDLGASHVDNSGTCANSIMNPVGSHLSTSFCAASKNQIQNYVSTYGSCLTTVGGTTPTPTPTPVGTYTLVASPSAIAAGGEVTVNWTAPSGSSTLDWIGLFKVGTSNSEYLGYIGTSGATSGNFTGVVTEPGQFEFRYLLNDGFKSVAVSNTVTVQTTTNPTPTPNITPTPVPTPTPTPVATPTPVTATASVSASSSTVAAGGSLNVSFSGVSSPSTTDWIGVYNVGAGASSYLSYVYTSSGNQSYGSTALSSGTVSVTFPTTAGTYELRLNRNNGFTTIATSASVTVIATTTATPTPNVTPTPVATPTPTTSRTNVALASNGSVATASSQFSSSYSPDLAINGIRNWASGGGGWKDATADSYPDWLQVDFNGSKTIDEISVFVVPDDFANSVDPTENTTFNLYGLTSFDVQYWNGSSWITVPNGSITNNNKVWTKLLFSAVTTTRIRVLVNSSLTSNSRIVELEAWSGGGSGVTPTPTPTPIATPTPTPVATPTPNTSRTNVALASNGSVATASSQFSSSYSPDLAINGIRNWASGGGGWKDATLDSYPDWLQVDFNGSKTIDEISVFVVPDDFASGVDPTENTTFSLYGLTGFEVQYWNGSSWVTVPNGSVTNNNKVWTKLIFSAVTTTRIRVVVNNSLTGYSRIVEVEAWSGGGSGVTPTPTPTSGAASLTTNSSMTSPGGTLNVTWSGITSPSTTDWIGVFNIGAGDFEYKSYIYTSSGTQGAGSIPSSAGTGLITFPTTSGTYELRLNRSNGSTRVVTSTQITVQ